jgi:hypothetical protein
MQKFDRVQYRIDATRCEVELNSTQKVAETKCAKRRRCRDRDGGRLVLKAGRTGVGRLPTIASQRPRQGQGSA